MSPFTPPQLEWFEERRRYQVLRFIIDRVGPDCDFMVSGPQIEVALAFAADEVQRIVGWLQQHGYVYYHGSRPDVCLTEKAVRYFEEASERRRSLRE